MFGMGKSFHRLLERERVIASYPGRSLYLEGVVHTQEWSNSQALRPIWRGRGGQWRRPIWIFPIVVHQRIYGAVDGPAWCTGLAKKHGLQIIGL